MNKMVSVIVVVYNSSSFIIEALDSVLNQTWKEIELIITDDCSTDDTIAICRSWIKVNSDRFIRSEIILSESNRGVPANLNQGLRAAKGVWVSLLAGDDCLKPNCVEDNMLWISGNPEIRVLFSRIEVYNNNFGTNNLIANIPEEPFNQWSIMSPGRSALSQYKMLLLCDRIHYTPSVFLHRETLLSVGGLDERFRLLEDYPLWLNLTKNGHKLHFMDKITVNYRQHSKAINNTGIKYLINPNYFRQENFRRIYTYPYLPADIRLNQRFTWYASQAFRCNWLNRNNLINRSLHSLLISYLNPFKYYIFLKKRICRSQKNNEFYM
jgi:glycosyltransferase involved in cell wall biosynthesis